MQPHISVLIAYFNVELRQLKRSYHWKIPRIAGFDRSGRNGYLANVELKKFLNRKWTSSNKQERFALSKSIVSDWGGVKRNKQETLNSYVNELDKSQPITPLKGVASYSKIFAVADMEKYVIYDARVAVCLNAVQWNSEIRQGIAFNYIPGRNNVTGHAGNRSGFAYDPQFKTRNLIKLGWKRLKRDETYEIYLETLKECLTHFPEHKLYDLEMTLFSNAEKECRKAMRSASNTATS